MNRRACLRWMAGVPALSPTVAHAQRMAKTHRVGVLMTTTPSAASHVVAALADGMRERGHVEGQNVIFAYRWAEGRPERYPELAADLVQQKVDVIVASSQGPALAAKRATATIPIVMVNAADPVEAGLVVSLARPGGNVTGLSQQLTAGIRSKQLQLLKEALPKVSRVVVLRSPPRRWACESTRRPGRPSRYRSSSWRSAAATMSSAPSRAVARERADAVLVPGDTLLFMERQRVAALAREHRLPGMYSLREFTEAGGLMSYSARLTEQFRRAAVYVDKILRGASPATLPVESPSHYELVINLNTARALGLTISPSFLLRADQVIE
jgi:ABC-type uncharacterized transport system substrate-binding protein